MSWDSDGDVQFTAAGVVSPAPSDGSQIVWASMTQGLIPVGACVAVAPPAGYNWAFNCSGLTPGQNIKFTVQASYGQQVATVGASFVCPDPDA